MDHYGAVNIKAVCSNGDVVKGSGPALGEWTNDGGCENEGEIVCGVRSISTINKYVNYLVAFVHQTVQNFQLRLEYDTLGSCQDSRKAVGRGRYCT